ncbi:unnamed protein product, partial [Acanthocheilonema viteae]
LRDFIIMVADRDREDEYEALEVHRMSRKGEKVVTIKYTGIVQARKQFFHLIRRINAYGNIMGPLPQNTCTIFKLTYYDETTPVNYEPQGFIADGDLFHFPKEIDPVMIGRFDCEKHMVTTSVHSIFMKSTTEMKSLMHADATKFNSSVSRDTTICSSPTKTLRTFSICTDEFSQVQIDDTEQQSEPMRDAGLTALSSCIDISGTLKTAEIYRTLSTESSISMESSKLSVESDVYENRTAEKPEHEGSIMPYIYNRALLILKRKKYQESVTEKMLQQLDTIERMVNDLEFAVIEQKVVEQLRHGNEVLKRMNQMISVDDIEQIMDETKEAADFQEEISNMLSGKLGEDELKEVEKEFAELVEKEGELNLPEVPSEQLAVKTSEKRSKSLYLMTPLLRDFLPVSISDRETANDDCAIAVNIATALAESAICFFIILSIIAYFRYSQN